MPRKSITPEMRVAEFLAEYPELEERLLSLSPAFEKLKNPLLRKTVAKVATLRQVAEVGKIPLPILMQTLLGEAAASGERPEAVEPAAEPDWIKNCARTIDARPMIEEGKQPLSVVMAVLRELKHEEVLHLLTPFVPAPLIDLAEKQGFTCYSSENDKVVHTYFRKT